MYRVWRQCSAGVLLSVLLLAFPPSAVSGQPEKIHFETWEFEPPPQLQSAEQTGDRLALRLHPSPAAGQRATITLHAPQSMRGDSDA